MTNLEVIYLEAPLVGYVEQFISFLQKSTQHLSTCSFLSKKNHHCKMTYNEQKKQMNMNLFFPS